MISSEIHIFCIFCKHSIIFLAISGESVIQAGEVKLENYHQEKLYKMPDSCDSLETYVSMIIL